MAQIEVGKYYSAYPEFTRFDNEQGAKKKRMSGLCIFALPRLVTLAFSNGIRESFRPDEVR